MRRYVTFSFIYIIISFKESFGYFTRELQPHGLSQLYSSKRGNGRLQLGKSINPISNFEAKAAGNYVRVESNGNLFTGTQSNDGTVKRAQSKSGRFVNEDNNIYADSQNNFDYINGGLENNMDKFKEIRSRQVGDDFYNGLYSGNEIKNDDKRTYLKKMSNNLVRLSSDSIAEKMDIPRFDAFSENREETDAERQDGYFISERVPKDELAKRTLRLARELYSPISWRYPSLPKYKSIIPSHNLNEHIDRYLRPPSRYQDVWRGSVERRRNRRSLESDNSLYKDIKAGNDSKTENLTDDSAESTHLEIRQITLSDNSSAHKIEMNTKVALLN